jgi:hypothetical protein
MLSCSACKFLGEEFPLEIKSKKLFCRNCLNKSKTTENLNERDLRVLFIEQSISGCKCKKCDLFNPNSLQLGHCVFCKNEILVNGKRSETDKVYKHKMTDLQSALTNVSIKHSFSSHDYTLIIKNCIFEALNFFIKQDYKEMKLFFTERYYGSMQSKIIQKAITILNNSIPYSYVKGGKRSTINNIFDLKLFTYVESKEEIINNKIIVKNAEQYVFNGQTDPQPYYIGKLISCSCEVKSYSFHHIKVNSNDNFADIVFIGITPNYQSGLLYLLNRLKKEIKDEFKLLKNM